MLIVDDEKLERVLIRKGYDWDTHGFEIVGEASSGAEALEFMNHRNPDLVITDINMPQMDGLELSQEIMQNYPGCHIIIVTGYRDFEYARRALRIGVEDFLLKPVNIQDIHDVTVHLKEKISKEQIQVHKVEELKESVLADHDILMESFFQRLVEKRISEEEAKRKLVVYNCEELMNQCICVDIRLSVNSEEKELSIAHKEVLHLIKKQNMERSVCFIHFMQNIIIYFTYLEQEKINQEIAKLKESMKQSGLYADFGISNANTGFSGIAVAYEEAEKAVGLSLLLQSSCPIRYKEFEEIVCQNSRPLEINWKDFRFNISNALYEKAISDIEQYVDNMKESGILDNKYLQVMAYQCMTEAAETLNKYGISFSEEPAKTEYLEKLRKCYRVENIKIILLEYVEMVMKYHDAKKTRQGNKVVKEALDFIQKNLYDPELSLHSVASAIFSNESYLSRVFKKETGLSLIEYISKNRIEESIRLLNNTNMKVYEIAEKVGFRDSHYFSICFKKQTGRTVKEFKAGNLQ